MSDRAHHIACALHLFHARPTFSRIGRLLWVSSFWKSRVHPFAQTESRKWFERPHVHIRQHSSMVIKRRYRRFAERVNILSSYALSPLGRYILSPRVTGVSSGWTKTSSCDRKQAKQPQAEHTTDCTQEAIQKVKIAFCLVLEGRRRITIRIREDSQLDKNANGE